MNALRVKLGWSPFLPHQQRVFDFDPPTSEEAALSIEALFGGYASGKTDGIMRKALRIAALNPWRDEYGSAYPTGIICAPTYRILRTATIPAFDKLLPRQIVRRRRGPPHNDILLTNGFLWQLFSAEAELEGITACCVVMDESDHTNFTSNPAKYLNLLARLRDPHSRRLALLAAGHPASGWLRETFDVEAPNRLTVLCSMHDNPHIPVAVRHAVAQDCPAGMEDLLIHGRWGAPQNAVYPQFDSKLHVIDAAGDVRKPVHLSLDVGNLGAVLVGQPMSVQVRNVVGQVSNERGLLICDQILTNNQSVETQCYRIRTETAWIVSARESVITVDPTIRRDELNAIRNHFPGVRISQRSRGDDLHPINEGVKVVQRALKDSLGNTRLFFARKISGAKNGVVEGMERYKRNPASNEPIKDNLRDHGLDALRYLVCEHLPMARPVARVLS